MSILMLRSSVAAQEEPEESELAQAAALLSAGDTASFEITGLDLQAESPSSARSAATFASRIVYDRVQKQLHFAGCSHTGGTPTSGAGVWVMYDIATHTFSRTEYAWAAVGVIGHAYVNTCVGPDGTLYHYIASANGPIYRKPNGSTTWATGFMEDLPTDNNNQVAVACEWFGEANSGAGGLAMADYQQCFISTPEVDDWNTFSASHSLVNDDYWSAKVDGFVHFGEGTTHRRLAPDGSSSARTAPPIAADTNNNGEGGTIVPSSDGTGLLLFEREGDKRVWYYDQTGNDWTEVGNHEFDFGVDSGSGTTGSPFTLLGTVHDLGIVMAWMHVQDGATTCAIWKET